MSEPRSSRGNRHERGSRRPAHAPGMWLSDVSIRRPVFIAMLVLATMVVGGISYSRMALDLFPDVSLPVAVVQTVYPGANPEEVERSVTVPVEDAVSSLNGVETVRSTSMDSLSLVIVEFDMNKDARRAAEDVRTRVDAIRNTLPTDVEEPVILQFDPSAAPVISFAIGDTSGRRSPEELRALAEDSLKPRIEQVPGVAAVEIVGGVEREVRVELDASQLEAHGVAPQQVVQAIRGENLDVPAGRIDDGRREESLRTAGEVRSLDQLAEIPIAARPGATIRVKNVARVLEGPAEARSLSRLDGRESVVAEVRKQSGTNTVRVADAVKRELGQLEEEHPEIESAVAFDQSTFTRDAVEDLQLSLLLGAVLASLVVLLFFRDLRNTLVTVAGLPVVLLGTFGAMHVLGLSLNMITLLALSLSVGMLVDDAIVVRENILRHMERGEQPKVAASRGTAEIALAVLAVSSTIVAVFLPIAFTEGIAGKFLRDFGLTAAIALVVSLVEALTLAPMLSAYFFRQVEPASARRRASTFGRLFELVKAGYRRLLAWSLGHRLVVALVGLAALAGSLAVVPLMVMSFIPQIDQGEFGVAVELPPGARLEDTDRAARDVERILRDAPEVEHVFTTVGSGDAAVERTLVHARLRSRGHTEEVIARVRPEVEKALGDARFTIDRESSAETFGEPAASAIRSQPIQFSVQGEDFELLDQVSADLVERLRQVPGAVDVDRSIREGRPSRQIVLDRAKASDQGLTTAQVGMTVRALVDGERAGTYRSDGQSLDIVVRLAAGDRDSPDDVLRLPMVTSRGTRVKLSEVASLVDSTEPAQIDRENRQRQVLVGAQFLGRDLGSVTADARAAAMAMSLPVGAVVKVSGEGKYQDEMFASLGLALELSVLFVYMILASQFGSFVHPLTIMLALPFSVVGALLSLFVAGFGFDMLGMIGMILLMGLVTKNSILLVEFVNQLRARGLDTRQAILEAGPIRLRPILMTTLAMIFGMVPVAAGFGAGSEMRQPMGVSVIGGLITSTLLTLVVVPVAYSLIDDLSRLVTRRRREAASEAGGAERALPQAAPLGAGRVALYAAVLTLIAGLALYRVGPVQPGSEGAATATSGEPRRSPPIPTPTGTSAPAVELARIDPVPMSPGPGAAMPAGGQPLAAAPARPPGLQVGNTGGAGVNVRESPGTQARRVTALSDGAQLVSTGETAESGGQVWMKVRGPNGAVGWVAKDYLVSR